MGCLRIAGWIFAPMIMVFFDLKNLTGTWRIIAIVWTALAVASYAGGLYAQFAANQALQNLDVQNLDVEGLMIELTPTIEP